MTDLSLDRLASFVAVAEELHYTRAAERVHVAQPALTKRIQQLEEAVGSPLFIRTRRSVRLTGAGELLLAKAREVLRAADQFGDAARQLREGGLGRLRIGFSPSAPHRVLPALMRAFRRRHPGIGCDLTELSSDAQLEQIRDGRLHVGLLRPPSTVPDGITCTTFFEEPFVAVVPRDHPLAHRRAVRLSELSGERFVAVSRRLAPAVHDQILGACAAAGFTPAVDEATHIHAVVALVAAGCGVSVLPRSAAEVGMKDAVCRPLRGSTIRTVMAIAHLDAGAEPAARAMAAVARQLDQHTSTRS
jgi:DNA-binding transcriptional LysR family regulator